MLECSHVIYLNERLSKIHAFKIKASPLNATPKNSSMTAFCVIKFALSLSISNQRNVIYVFNASNRL